MQALKNAATILESGIREVYFGVQVTVIQPVNLYGCIIGDHSFVGPFTEIQQGVEIGSHTKVQSHSFICEGVTIGNRCFIGHGVKFVNDTFSHGRPAGGRKELWLATNIADDVYIGSNATILPVSICSNVVIGAGAVVTRSISTPGIYAGNPARLFRTLPPESEVLA